MCGWCKSLFSDCMFFLQPYSFVFLPRPGQSESRHAEVPSKLGEVHGGSRGCLSRAAGLTVAQEAPCP